MQDRINEIENAIFSKKRIAFVGVAKNSGKTTTMNWCLSRAFKTKKQVLALSIGLDGERLDALLGTPKPPVQVHSGQWCITTQKMVECADATLKIQKNLGIRTPLGDTVLAKVVRAGDVVLTGLRHRRDLAEVQDNLPLDHVFIDGAYGRLMAAHANISDGIIVSTGGVVGDSMKRIVEKTQNMVTHFEYPLAKTWRRKLFIEARDQNASRVGGPHSSQPLAHPSALIGLSGIETIWTDESSCIAVVGLLSDSIVKLLLELDLPNDEKVIVVEDPTSIHLKPILRNKFLKKWKVEVFSSNKVIAIAVNPTSVQGHRFEVGEIDEKLISIWPKLAIFDPIAIVVG